MTRRKIRRRLPRPRSGPAYLEKIAAAGLLPSPGGFAELVVEHDRRCPFWRGRPCSCDPTIRPVSPIAGNGRGLQ